MNLGEFFVAVVDLVLLCMWKGGCSIILCFQHFWYLWCKIKLFFFLRCESF